MMKFIVLFALFAVSQAAPPTALVATPLLAKLQPQPEAPANTEHATHVAAAVPVAQAITYTAPLIPQAQILAHAPTYHASPIAYAAGYSLGYAAPVEAHSYRIAY